MLNKFHFPAAYKIYIPAAIGLLLIGVLYVSTNMLGFSQEYMDYLIKTVNETPSEFGGWIGSDNGKVSENEEANEAILKESGALAQISRVYENAGFGERINLYFIAGVSFRVAMHSPEACYPGSGFERQGEKQKFEFDYIYTNSQTGKKYARKATFYTVVFQKEDKDRNEVFSERVFWAWNDGSGWQAPDKDARFYYSGHIPLCKCYFSFLDNSSNPVKFDKTYIVDFATRFLSDLDNRMIEDGQLPFIKKEVELGNPIADVQEDTPQPEEPSTSNNETKADSQTEADIQPNNYQPSHNFDSLIKESEISNK